MKYLKGEREIINDCLFCHLLAKNNDEETLIVHRGEHCFVILNRFPYNTGHTMVIPNAHIATLEDATVAAVTELMTLTQASIRAMRAIYAPQGFNVGINIGDSAGAGIPEHMHQHIVPRWAGDTNFISTIGETRVLPEELPETWQKLRAALPNFL